MHERLAQKYDKGGCRVFSEWRINAIAWSVVGLAPLFALLTCFYVDTKLLTKHWSAIPVHRQSSNPNRAFLRANRFRKWWNPRGSRCTLTIQEKYERWKGSFSVVIELLKPRKKHILNEVIYEAKRILSIMRIMMKTSLEINVISNFLNFVPCNVDIVTRFYCRSFVVKV